MGIQEEIISGGRGRRDTRTERYLLSAFSSPPLPLCSQGPFSVCRRESLSDRNLVLPPETLKTLPLWAQSSGS